MRKHPSALRVSPALRPVGRQPQALTLARVDDDRWQPEASLNGPRCCPEYAVWQLGPSRERRKKLVVL